MVYRTDLLVTGTPVRFDTPTITTAIAATPLRTRRLYNATHFQGTEYQHEIANHYRDLKEAPASYFAMLRRQRPNGRMISWKLYARMRNRRRNAQIQCALKDHGSYCHTARKVNVQGIGDDGDDNGDEDSANVLRSTGIIPCLDFPQWELTRNGFRNNVYIPPPLSAYQQQLNDPVAGAVSHSFSYNNYKYYHCQSSFGSTATTAALWRIRSDANTLYGLQQKYKREQQQQQQQTIETTQRRRRLKWWRSGWQEREQREAAQLRRVQEALRQQQKEKQQVTVQKREEEQHKKYQANRNSSIRKLIGRRPLSTPFLEQPSELEVEKEAKTRTESPTVYVQLAANYCADGYERNLVYLRSIGERNAIRRQQQKEENEEEEDEEEEQQTRDPINKASKKHVNRHHNRNNNNNNQKQKKLQQQKENHNGNKVVYSSGGRLFNLIVILYRIARRRSFRIGANWSNGIEGDDNDDDDENDNERDRNNSTVTGSEQVGIREIRVNITPAQLSPSILSPGIVQRSMNGYLNDDDDDVCIDDDLTFNDSNTNTTTTTTNTNSTTTTTITTRKLAQTHFHQLIDNLMQLDLHGDRQHLPKIILNSNPIAAATTTTAVTEFFESNTTTVGDINQAELDEELEFEYEAIRFAAAKNLHLRSSKIDANNEDGNATIIISPNRFVE